MIDWIPWEERFEPTPAKGKTLVLGGKPLTQQGAELLARKEQECTTDISTKGPKANGPKKRNCASTAAPFPAKRASSHAPLNVWPHMMISKSETKDA